MALGRNFPASSSAPSAGTTAPLSLIRRTKSDVQFRHPLATFGKISPVFSPHPLFLIPSLWL